MNLAIFISIVLLIIAFLILISDFLSPVSPQSIDYRLKKLQFTSVKHKWDKTQKSGIYFCNGCRGIISGIFNRIYQCRICGMIIHSLCRSKLKYSCKFVTSNKMTQQNLHQWVQGNLKMNTMCDICHNLCTNTLGCDGKACIWCQLVVHRQCKSQMIQQCTYGKHRNCIIEPKQVKTNSLNSITTIFKRSKSSKRKEYKSSDQSQTEKQDIIFNINENKEPILVIINHKSGEQDGINYLKTFYRYLNPIQVISIIDQGLTSNILQTGIKLFAKIKNLKIIIGGGDGTICSTISYIKSGIINDWQQKNPPIAIMPLGTGNDLSRSLGWGGEFLYSDVSNFLFEVMNKKNSILLDRWLINIDPKQGEYNKIGIKHYMYNYVGIGLDAKICLAFHELRQSHPFLFFSRIVNKLIYFKIASFEFFHKKFTKNKQCLSQMVQLLIDQQKIDLSEIQNIVILNIPSWSGGVQNLWQKKYTKQNKPSKQKFLKMSFSDRLLQVIGVQNFIHLAQIQIGMDQPIKLGQGRNIKIIFKNNSKVPVQIDGQPYEMEGPIMIEINHYDQIYMLNHCEENDFQWQSKVIKVLDDCKQQKIITEQQKQILLKKLTQ